MLVKGKFRVDFTAEEWITPKCRVKMSENLVLSYRTEEIHNSTAIANAHKELKGIFGCYVHITIDRLLILTDYEEIKQS